jgi:hypothetical protein
MLTAEAIDDRGASSFSSSALIEVYPYPSTILSPVRLGYWRFEDTNWLGDFGQSPKGFGNIECVALSPSNHVLKVDSPGPAVLIYRDVENTHKPNIDLQQGTIVFRFNPTWASSNAGGTGPGALGQLISVGEWTADASHGCWNLMINADGNSIVFQTQSNGIGQVNLSASVSFGSNEWHQLALTYSSSNCAFYIDSICVASSGVGVGLYPEALVRALDGFCIGGSRTGAEQARGLFDDLETFNYPLSASELSQRPDSDNDGLPDGWELLYSFDPYDPGGDNGATGTRMETDS